jgi:hypothetical protein
MEGITALEDVVGRWEVHLISLYLLIFSQTSFERKRASTAPGFFGGFFGSGIALGKQARYSTTHGRRGSTTRVKTKHSVN